MDKSKILHGTVGVVEISAGVALKLAELGLSVSEVVLSGAENLANTFVQSSLKNTNSPISKAKKLAGKWSQKLLQKGCGRF